MASWTGCFLLTSTLLSSDPALLRRPRFPAQNMQYQRLDTHTRPGATAACRCHCPELGLAHVSASSLHNQSQSCVFTAAPPQARSNMWPMGVRHAGVRRCFTGRHRWS